MINHLIAEDFNNIFELVTLNLGNNLFTQVPNIGTAKSKLENLYMDKNHISLVRSEEMAGYLSLKTLSLKDNRIEEFPDLGDAKPTLKILNLQNNFIKYTQRNMFKGYGSLKYLTLKSNLLSECPDLHFIQNKAFARLFFGTNKITHFYPWVMAPLNLNFITKIQTHNNPIICDCRVIYFVKYANSYPTRLQSVACDSPPYLKNLKIQTEISLDQLQCKGLFF